MAQAAPSSDAPAQTATATQPVAQTYSEAVSQAMSPAEMAKAVQYAEPVGSGLSTDMYHRASSFLTQEMLGQGQTLHIENARGIFDHLIVQGGVNDKMGYFNYIIDSSGQLTHQLFNEGIITLYEYWVKNK